MINYLIDRLFILILVTTLTTVPHKDFIITELYQQTNVHYFGKTFIILVS